MTTCPFEAEFAAVEAAIEAHAQLELADEPAPLMSIDRHGARMRIRVKLQKSRKRPVEIAEFGDTPAEAAARLIQSLDYWAGAMK